MNPTNSQLRQLRSHAARLKARLAIGRAGLTDACVAQVRHAFERESLIKVRVGAHDREAIDEIGQKLAAQVPCTLVSRVGFVLTLFRPGPNNPLAERDTGPDPDAG